eukprot:m.84596 g.84596  ORF g.84596 m.84596 type:complete len:308 (+) comp14393_c5_seq1:219-1142(+)
MTERGYNPLLVREHPEVGRAPRPEDPKVLDIVHGVTARAIDDKVAFHEACIKKKRPPVGNHVGYQPPPTPRLGTSARAPQASVLLKKSQVGMSLSMGTKEMQEMVHGVRTHKTRSVHDSLTSWDTVAQTLPQLKKEKPKLDYIEMNRRAITRGLVSPREQLSMRQTEVVYQRQKSPYRRKTEDTSYLQSLVHGRRSEYSTSVAELMTSMAGDKWLAERKALEVRQHEAKRAAQNKGYAMTRAAILRTKRPEPPAEPLWQMKRFQNVQPSLSTFRTDAAKEHSKAQHELLSTDRVGFAGQGVPKSLIS